MNFLKLILLTMTLISTTNASSETKLPLCPDSPNCVSSQAKDPGHYVEPFKLIVATETAWTALQDALKSMPRTRIISVTENSLHAEASSLVFRFVDDVNAILDAEAQLIEIRSASRTGYSDFGVNRKRIENLRKLLITAKVIE